MAPPLLLSTLRIATLVAAGLTVLTSCGPIGASPTARASTSPVTDCRHVKFPFRQATAQLSAMDSGKTFEVAQGSLVSVSLVGQGRHWQPIETSGSALLRLPDPAMAATVGTQLAMFCAVGSGTETLTSSNESTRWKAIVAVQ